MPIRIRAQQDVDGEDVRRVLLDAFPDDPVVADLAQARSRTDIGAGLVAVDDADHVVGHTQLSVSWVDAPRRLVTVLTLSPAGRHSSPAIAGHRRRAHRRLQVRTLDSYDSQWMSGALVYNDTFWSHDSWGCGRSESPQGNRLPVGRRLPGCKARGRERDEMFDVDRAGFERFVDEHGDRLLHAAYGLCGDWQHAEDLVQHALTALARRWSAVSSNPLGYTYRCLARANIDRWRVMRRRPEVLLDPQELATVGPVSDPVSPEDQLMVLAALQTLPRHQRAILVLRYLQDLSESDTAAALGISVGAVKSGAARGLARLRAEQSTRLTEAHHE